MSKNPDKMVRYSGFIWESDVIYFEDKNQTNFKPNILGIRAPMLLLIFTILSFQAYLVTLIYVPAALLSYPREGRSRLSAFARSTFIMAANPLVIKAF